MALFKEKYRIESSRLPWWDYSEKGAYLITICTRNRDEIFGEIRNGIMGLNELGCMVAKYWQDIPDHFNNVVLDEWVVMPNHFHGIIIVNRPLITFSMNSIHAAGSMDDVEKIHELSLRNREIQNKNINIFDTKFGRKMIIPKIIGRFKMQASKEINQMFGNSGKSIWQPNYHDRIIRDETELNNKRRYIRNNPQKWETDRNNTKNPTNPPNPKL